MTDIVRQRGDTYADQFAISSKQTGESVNITGFSFLLTLDPEKYPVNSDNNIYQLVGVITDAAGGVVEFSPSAVQSDLVGKNFYDVQMTDAAGKIRTIAKGSYKYVQDITK